MLGDSALRTALADIERQLVNLRGRFEALIKSGEIKPCGCKDPDCPTFTLSPRAIGEMDTLRANILSDFSKVFPEFTVQVGWH
jgi:hypothetical protein